MPAHLPERPLIVLVAVAAFTASAALTTAAVRAVPSSSLVLSRLRPVDTFAAPFDVTLVSLKITADCRRPDGRTSLSGDV